MLYKSFHNAINKKSKNKVKTILIDNGIIDYELIKKAYFLTKIENRLDKLFYNLINPDEYNIKEYYQIFYYYWKCFFAIVDDLHKIDNNNSKIKLSTLNGYLKYVKDIYEKEYINNFDYNGTYYGLILNKIINNTDIKINSIVTTNYTNLVNCFKPYTSVYNIHGTLNQFEASKNLDFFKISKALKYNEEFFPFIMGMSNLKPIINYEQINVMSNAFKKNICIRCFGNYRLWN